jgi:hypothetical protein
MLNKAELFIYRISRAVPKESYILKKWVLLKIVRLKYANVVVMVPLLWLYEAARLC